jgi:hypothetical protein
MLNIQTDPIFAAIKHHKQMQNRLHEACGLTDAKESLTSVLEKLKALDAQRAQLLEGAKKTLLSSVTTGRSCGSIGSFFLGMGATWPIASTSRVRRNTHANRDLATFGQF